MLSSNCDVEGKKKQDEANMEKLFISLDWSFAGMSYVPAVCCGGRVSLLEQC